MSRTNSRPVPYQFPKSKLCDDIAQRSSTTTENPVRNFLEELRKGVLEQLEKAAEEEYKLYLQQFDEYLQDAAQSRRHAYKPHFVESDREILRMEDYAAKVSESVLATCTQHLQDSSERLSVILEALLLLVSQRDAEDTWYYDTKYRHLLTAGLLSVYVAHRSTLDAKISLEEKNRFILYAMEGILPDDSDYGGPGLAAYVECASILAELQELGFSCHAALLRISTAADPDIDWEAIDDEEATALTKIMDFKRKIAFFTCADLFLDAGTWIENNLDFETAKRFGANPYHERSFSARYVHSAVSAFNEDSGWKLGRFTLTDQERNYPIHHVVPLQRKVWSTTNDRSTTIDEKMTLSYRSNDAKAVGDRLGTVSMQDDVGIIKKETFEKVFGTRDAERLITLVETRIAQV